MNQEGTSKILDVLALVEEQHALPVNEERVHEEGVRGYRSFEIKLSFLGRNDDCFEFDNIAKEQKKDINGESANPIQMKIQSFIEDLVAIKETKADLPLDVMENLTLLCSLVKEILESKQLKLPKQAPEIYKYRVDRKETPISFLKRVWGQYLDAGILYQDNLGGRNGLDRSLIAAINNYCNHHKIDRSQVIPPPKSARIDKILELAPPVNELLQQANGSYRRLTA